VRIGFNALDYAEQVESAMINRIVLPLFDRLSDAKIARDLILRDVRAVIVHPSNARASRDFCDLVADDDGQLHCFDCIRLGVIDRC
jgi:hypothetical protein